MRRTGCGDRVDTNHGEIVKALRAVGASVQSLAPLGKGCPDLLVGFRGVNYVLEVKYGKGKRNDGQVDWHTAWRGRVATVSSVDEALAAVGALANFRTFR